MKHSKTTIYALVIVLIVLLGAGYTYTRIQADKASLSDILQTVSKEVPAKLPDYAVRITPEWQGSFDGGEIKTIAPYKFRISSGDYPGISFYPAAQKYSDANGPIVPKQGLDKLDNALVASFKKHGVNAMTPGQAVVETGQYKEYEFTRRDETCTTKTDTALYQLHIICRSAALDKAQANKAKPFVTAFLKNKPNLTDADITVGPIQIKSRNQKDSPITGSKTANYDLAEAYIQTAGTNKFKTALFYNKSGADWVYVTSANDEFGFSCEDITKDPDARKAMYDQICYQANTGQVRLDTTNRALQ